MGIQHLPSWAAGTWRLTLFCTALIASGCATTAPQIMDRVDDEGQAYARKRVERNPERDFWHHWSRQAYVKPQAKMWAMRDSDQAIIVGEWGPPDAVRKPFRSLGNEPVREWLYYDQRMLFQFIGNREAYEGPLTDYERLLLERGYPDRIIFDREASGRNESIFIYHKLFRPILDQYTLVDGKLIQSLEGN